jgi:gas vesicle protein
MNENNDGEFGAFLAGFVIGGLVGAAAALILAPQSGSETRSQIASKTHDLREAGDRRMHQARDSADHYMHRSDQPDGESGYDAQEQARIILDSGRQQSVSTDDNNNLTTEDDIEASAAS